MKVTVCQLSNDRVALENEWSSLVDHCRTQQSELVLLPEMPFARWLASSNEVDQAAWMSAIVEHDSWRRTLVDLVPAIVLSTEPVVDDGTNYNEAFVWSAMGGRQAAHRKYYLPNEPGFWEANWYQRGAKEFEPLQLDPATIGFLVCTEMWFTEHAREYARQGVGILAAPRATGASSASKWLAGGQAAAVMSGAFCLSSNRSGTDRTGFEWGGQGWIIEPEEGEVLAVTSESDPFVTVDIDLGVAQRAKQTYPRYVAE